MAWPRIRRMVCDNFCKLLQRQTYTFLSSRHGMLLFFLALFLGLLSIVQFGEVVLQWSVVKYQRTVLPYHDNIVHKSYQNRLCLPMPIDVVYTWVNGTDPVLLKQLAKLKQEMEERLNKTLPGMVYEETQAPGVAKSTSIFEKGAAKTSSKLKSEICPYENCVPLNSLILKVHSPVRIEDLRAVDPVFQHALKVSNFTLKTPSKVGLLKTSLLTIVKFSKESSWHRALNRAFTIKGEKVVTQRAYLTSQSVELGVRLRAVAMVLVKSAIHDGDAFKDFLYFRFADKVRQLEYYEKERVAVLTFKNDKNYNDAIGLRKGVITFQNIPLVFEPAMMVWEPFPSNIVNDYDNHFLASRFADNQELRYSLRSVEKHAPWVRKIFIITNGQIPSWLNLDNPRVQIVTHSDIFTNKSHLPTFSSPAIESHIHKIPGLSKKFIYLNDDVMFGSEVWPDDFFTHAKGQKVFLSWPVPNCNEGCPSTWINDKYCDKACNVSDCDWDGGDCLGTKAKSSRYESAIASLKSVKVHDFCNSGCADSWIGDRYCDAACNNPSCGLDAGDCGVKHFSQLYSVQLNEDTKLVHLPSGLHSMYFNLSEVFGQGKIIEGEQDGSQVLRSVTIAQKFKVMTITFYPNQTLTTVSVRVAGFRTVNNTNKVEIKCSFTIETITKPGNDVVQRDIKSAPPSTASADSNKVPTTLYPIRIYNESNNLIYWNAGVDSKLPLPTWSAVDKKEYCIPEIPDDMTVPEDVVEKIAELEKDLKSGDITKKGYNRKKAKVLKESLGLACDSDFYPTTLYAEMRQVKSVTGTIIHSQPTSEATQLDQTLQPSQRFFSRHLNNYLHQDTEWSFLPWERQGVFKTIQELREKRLIEESYKTMKFPQRSLLDAFSGSLLHVNRIYNKAFGYKPRKVPSHMPHMIDVDIMTELQAKFPQEFDKTSSHKLRSPDDMQFALSYFYYVIDQTKEFNVSQVFKEVDADKSGTLSDREFRTLLTKCNKLPLDSELIQKYATILRNCSDLLGRETHTRPKTEQQHGYNLPLVTEILLESCEPIVTHLNNSKKKESKFKHEIMGEEDVVFRMIRNNVTRVLAQLDEIRKSRKKFICLNDNIDHEKGNASLVKNVLVDFYESLFPVPSQFELPNNLRNQFLNVNELQAWRDNQRSLELAWDGLFAVVAVILVVCLFWHQLFSLVRCLLTFFARKFRTPRLSTASSTKLLTV